MSWSYAYDPQIWPALITAILTAILGWYGWQRRNVSGAKPFVIICLFAFLWAVGSIFEIAAIDLSAKIFWIKFQGIWQLPEAYSWLWFVLVYAGFSRWLTRGALWLTVIPSLFAAVLIMSNYHHLVWTDFQMGNRLIQVFGIGNWILIAFAFILILLTVVVLFWLVIRSSHLRWPAIIMLLGMVIAFGMYLLANIDAGFLGPGERILFTMGILSLSFSVALFRFRALDPVPLAYSAIIKQMQAGVLVFDLQRKVVDLNPAAGQILGSPPESLRGRPAAEILPAELSIPTWLEKPDTVPSEIELKNGSATHYFNLKFTPLTDPRNRTLGHLLFLYDVSEQRQAQAKIMEQQKVVAMLAERERLARELHDGIAQTLGYASMQAQIVRKLVRDGNLEKVGSILDRLIEVTQDAHADIRESILNLKAGPAQEWFLFPTLKQYLSRFQEFYGIRTELSVPDGLGEDIFEPVAKVQLLRVVQEALTNARKHSNARNIQIVFQQANNRALITIADDGKGFDPGQLKPEEGRHLGLGFMRERMEQVGGSLTIDSQPGAGTVVKLAVPLRNQKEENP